MVAMRSTLLLGAAVTGFARPASEIVLARVDGAVDWIRDHSAAPVTVYNQGAKLEAADSGMNIVQLANVGNEAHAFLQHIVSHYDSLADKVVFMPGARPTEGFQGFSHGTGRLLPGVTPKDYVAQSLFVPTMAVSPDLKQVSVRTAYMEGTPEQNDGKFSVCSAHGTNGWSPFMPNTFVSNVLEPMIQQHMDAAGNLEFSTFGDFWQKHLPATPLPEALRVAHGSMFSVSREDILRHPKSFYEKLLADVSGDKGKFLSLFVEHMWWYIFHHEGELCSTDLPAASRMRRRLSPYAIVEPRAGDKLDFGVLKRIEWTTPYTTGSVPYRVEIWKYGSFLMSISEETYDLYYEWLISPDSADKNYKSNEMASGETRTGVQLEPGDHYTIRICDGNADKNALFAERICDDTYAESGEFDIKPTLTMQVPCDLTVNAENSLEVMWQSYYLHGLTMTLQVVTAQDHLVFEDYLTNDPGHYNFYVPYDMAAGEYRVKLTAKCDHLCSNAFTGSSFSTTAESCPFTVLSATPPPPSPPPPGGWEIPVMKAFESGYNAMGDSAFTASNGDYFSSTKDEDKSCEDICFAGLGRRHRSLLFGGLGYVPTPNKGVYPCTSRRQECNCC